MITQEELKELLDYNLETGVFTWLKDNRSKKNKGLNAGCLDSHGYIIIRINNINYKAHRLAWFYVYGEWPKNQIDHINGIRSDNRIENLRDVTQRENHQNKQIHREGHILGVSINSKKQYFSSYFHYNGKQYHLGNFKTKNECNQIYNIAIKNYKNFIEWFKHYKKNKKDNFYLNINGCSFHKPSKKWYSSIRIDGKKIHIGSYNTKKEAHEAYLSMRWLLKEINK